MSSATSSPPQTPKRSQHVTRLPSNPRRALSPPASPSPLANSLSPSGASTPTTARRPSGPPLHGATSPPTGSKSSKARDLLRKHYGLGIHPPTPSGRPMDPMDLDSPAFDPKVYYEQLITTSSLTALLKKENELLTDMRELDSERQSLVYNHHHELIAATDTISAMKTRAESLDGDLELLRAAFSEISRLSAEVAIEQREPTPTAHTHSSAQ
ncbi:hypothetical protein PENSPDRAFT_618813 [Peniophora sp. CONT]|nr:hypothetical protein PENSPDRAFT_618813 [Peniophora sp. CONT]